MYGPTRLSTMIARDAMALSDEGSPTSATIVSAGSTPSAARTRLALAPSRPAAAQHRPPAPTRAALGTRGLVLRWPLRTARSRHDCGHRGSPSSVAKTIRLLAGTVMRADVGMPCLDGPSAIIPPALPWTAGFGKVS